MIASATGNALYAGINACTNPSQLDGLARRIWGELSQSTITDDEASYLSACIDRRRPQRATTAPAKLNSRVSRFAPRPCRKRRTEEDRVKRRSRKRQLGGSSALPAAIRHHYTEGERAVLCIVAGEVKRYGLCDLSIDEIADRAGFGRTTVQNALHEARRLGHVTVTERPRAGLKSLTNVVRLASREWLAWIGKRIGSNSFESANTSKNRVVRKSDPGVETSGHSYLNPARAGLGSTRRKHGCCS